MPSFREQGHGVLINNLTGYAKMGAPYLSAYISSKFALRGASRLHRHAHLPARGQPHRAGGEAAAPRHLDMRKLSARYPMPGPLALNQLERFLEESGDKYPVQWVDVAPPRSSGARAPDEEERGPWLH